MPSFTTVILSSAAVLMATTARAACTITGYSGTGCTGTSGNVRDVGSSFACVQMGGRQSYRLSDDCGSVEVDIYNGDECGGDLIGEETNGSGCHDIAAASVEVRTV